MEASLSINLIYFNLHLIFTLLDELLLGITVDLDRAQRALFFFWGGGGGGGGK